MIEGSIQGLLDRVYILTVHLLFMLLLEGKKEPHRVQWGKPIHKRAEFSRKCF